MVEYPKNSRRSQSAVTDLLIPSFMLLSCLTKKESDIPYQLSLAIIATWVVFSQLNLH